MSRWIDADALITKLKEYNPQTSKVKVAQIVVNNLPSIDIVRCKECKHNYNTAINHGKMQPRCDFADWKLTENDFCSRGERKESE